MPTIVVAKSEMSVLEEELVTRKVLPLLFGASVLAWILLVSAIGVSMSAEASKLVKVRDECTESFNVFFGDPTICQQPDGKVDIFVFFNYLSRHQRHPLWRFDPESFDLPKGKQVALQNLGGEFHTWTKVAEFGGGVIPELNFGQAARPECFQDESINNVFLEYGDLETGATAGSADLPAGTHKFMCCIHPWMKTVVKVN